MLSVLMKSSTNGSSLPFGWFRFQTAQGLHSLYPVKRLSTHGHQFGLVEAGLVLVRHQQDVSRGYQNRSATDFGRLAGDPSMFIWGSY